MTVHIKDNIYDVTEAGKEVIKIVRSVGSASVKVQGYETIDVADLRKKLQEKLYQYIKSDNIVGFGNVSFIPTARDLEDFLIRFRRKYEDLWNVKNIEKALLDHVERCAKTDKYAPAVKYFIIKEGSGSQLADVLSKTSKSAPDKDIDQFNITNTNDLFG